MAYGSYFRSISSQHAAQPSGGMIWVQGDGEAVNYVMAPNCYVTMRSTDMKKVYFKQTDASGRPTLEKYRLAPDVEEAPAKPEYVTRKEFDEFVRRMKPREEQSDE